MCDPRIPKDYVRMVEETFEEFLVEWWEFRQDGRKHPFVVFDLPGRGRLRFTLPSSPSARNGVANSRAQLRRLCRRPDVYGAR